MKDTYLCFILLTKLNKIYLIQEFKKINLTFQKPVVITDSKLIKSAEKWDLQYLEEHMGNANYTVYISKDHKFKYYDHERVVKNIFDKAFDFTPPIKIVDMKFRDYLKRLRDWKEGEER